MKVLYVIDTLNVGGAERSMLEIARRFKQVDAVFCHVYPGEQLRESYEAAELRVISLNVRGRYSLLEAGRRLGAVISEERPDVVHSMLFRAGMAARLAHCGRVVPLVHTFVGEAHYAERAAESSSYGIAAKRRVINWLERYSAPRVTHFLANSGATRDECIRSLRISESRISVIWRGRDPSDIDAGKTHDGSGIREELGISADSLVLLNVARLTSQKGQENLVRAVPLLLSRWPNLHVVIAGEGPHRPVLERTIQEEKLEARVHLLGTRTDVPALLCQADLFVFPSFYEGHSGAVIEAMFAGLPIVASDIGPNRESIQDLRTGRLARADDPRHFAAVIEWMLEHPSEAAAMARHAQDRARADFHIDRVAERHEELYRRLIPSARTVSPMSRNREAIAV